MYLTGTYAIWRRVLNRLTAIISWNKECKGQGTWPYKFSQIYDKNFLASLTSNAFFCWLIPDGSSKRLSTSIKCPDDTRPFDVSLLNCTQAPLPPSLEWWICIRGIHALPKRLSLKNPFSHNWKHSVWSKRFVSLKDTTTVNNNSKIKWYKSWVKSLSSHFKEHLPFMATLGKSR